MIVIVSSSAAERRAFAALCDSRDWPSAECDSLRAARKSFSSVAPRAVLTRHQLRDGYSDDVLTALAAAGLLPAVKVVVLLGPGAASAQVSRQVALGADCVLRDPVHTDVLAEYLAKYRRRAGASRREAPPSPSRKNFPFAGAIVDPVARRLSRNRRQVALTPRELQLVELLAESRGEVVTYATLYSEILGSKFRGDTSNMRVLLGRIDAAFRTLGLGVRDCLEVISKTGYRYRPPRAQPLATPRRAARPTAA